jgi:hypothetical protein
MKNFAKPMDGFGIILEMIQFVDAIARRAVEMYGKSASISNCQRRFLCIVLSFMVLNGTLILGAAAAASLAAVSAASLSYMFKNSKFPLDGLITAAICCLFEIYRPTQIALAIDDTDRHRTRSVKTIAFVFKTICKVTKGYVMAQNIVFVCLVTDRFTIPISWSFYSPDPELKKWEKEIKRLKKLGIRKAQRPEKPPRHPDHPTRIDLCERLLWQTKDTLQEVSAYLRMPVRVYVVVADAAYMSPDMCRYVRIIFKVNFVSQIKSNQLVIVDENNMGVDDYFEKN